MPNNENQNNGGQQDVQELKVRAKKISKITEFNNDILFSESEDKLYLLITYAPENKVPQNFKISIDKLADEIRSRVEVLPEEDVVNLLKNIFATDEELFNELKGKSAYQIALEEGLTTAETEAEWIESLNGLEELKELVNNDPELKASLKGDKGDPGENGKSAYELAIENGQTQQETSEGWINEMKEDLFTESYAKINDVGKYLYTLVMSYHLTYDIHYDLENVIADSINPTTMGAKDSVSLKFRPVTGYILPSSCNVTGAQYTYTKSTGTIKIYNPEHISLQELPNIDETFNEPTLKGTPITVTLKATTKIECRFTNGTIDSENYVNATLEANIDNKLYVGDRFIVYLSLRTPTNMYRFPSTLNATGCTIDNYDSTTGVVTLICSGTHTVMSLSGEAVDIAPYYFSYGLETNSSIFTITNNEITNVNWETIQSLEYTVNTIGTTPIDYINGITWDPSLNIKGKNVWMIIPTKYYNDENNYFIDDSKNRYVMIDTFGNTITSVKPVKFVDDSNEIEYCLFNISNNGILGTQKFKKI